MNAPGEPRIFIGIDGGGTHTRAAIVGEDGTVLGIGAAGPSNFQTAGVAIARESIGAAVAAAREGMRGRSSHAEGAFLGIAGVASATDRATVMSIVEPLGLAKRVEVDHDIRTALAGGLAGEGGIALIAGTGSSCYGRDDSGRFQRSGGWGHILDDLGSGYWIGVQGMIAITRAADGRATSTALTTPLMAALGITGIDDILRLAGSEALSRTEIAALAPLVLETARGGDRAATDILERGAAELALMVSAVGSRLEMAGDITVVMIGGLASEPRYAAMIGAAIAKHLPGARTIPPILPPLLGAALLAIGSAGIGGPSVIARMDETYRHIISHFPIP